MRRLAAILAADVIGYSRLMERDEAHVLAAMRALRAQVIDPLIAKYEGRIVKLMGDGLLVEFRSVVDAVRAAIGIQRQVLEQQAAAPPDRRIVFRMGVHLGDVVVEGEDLLGDGVNIAARLEQLCEPGGILVSGAAYDQLHGKVDAPLKYAGEQKLRNIDRKVRIYRIQLAADAKPSLSGMEPRTVFAAVAGAVIFAIALMVAALWWILAPGAHLAAVEPEAAATPAGEAPLLGASAPTDTANLQPTEAPAPGRSPAPAVGATEGAPSLTPNVPTTPTALPASPPAAATPSPAPEVAVLARPDKAAQVRRTIEEYDGGPCFYALPVDVSETAATVEAFASSISPVQALDDSFRQLNGFEAQIGLRQVTSAQCAAVDLLRELSSRAARSPTVRLDSFVLRDGQPLLGTIRGSDGGALSILIVDDKGAVHDVSDTVTQGVGEASFRVGMNAPGGGVKPLLLVVIAGPASLATLGPGKTLPKADALFPALADELRRSGNHFGAALKYVRLEG